MKCLFKLSLVIIMLFLLSGCWQQGNQRLEIIQKNTETLFNEYKQGVNTLNQEKLAQLIGTDFSFYGGNKTDYIQQLLTWTVFIEDIKPKVTAVEEYKIITEVETKGTIFFKPSVKLPLFKDKLPLLQGNFKNQALFVLAYAKDGLKIIGTEDGGTVKDFQWGSVLPEIRNFTLDKYTVSPGESLKVAVSADKGGNDVLFVFLNDRLLSGFSDRGEVPYNDDNSVIRVPLDYPKGKPFDITAMVFAGRLDLVNPQQAELQGIIVKTISVPVN